MLQIQVIWIQATSLHILETGTPHAAISEVLFQINFKLYIKAPRKLYFLHTNDKYITCVDMEQHKSLNMVKLLSYIIVNCLANFHQNQIVYISGAQTTILPGH